MQLQFVSQTKHFDSNIIVIINN